MTGAGGVSKDPIHTIAFHVDDRQETIADLESKQVRVIGGAFVHPGSAHGVLLRLAETYTHHLIGEASWRR